MIWLDGLDLPQFQHYPVHFVQHYSEPRYPAEDAPKSPLVYPWAEMQKKLDASPESHTIVRYTSQEPGQEGHEVSKIIGAQCERIAAGTTTEVVQETTSAVYHVVDGAGSSKIGDKTIDWVKGDTFSVPAWAPYSHEVSRRSQDEGQGSLADAIASQAAETTYLYRFDDRPMITALGFYRNAKEEFYDKV